VCLLRLAQQALGLAKVVQGGTLAVLVAGLERDAEGLPVVPESFLLMSPVAVILVASSGTEDVSLNGVARTYHQFRDANRSKST
jgi:hypothetical protein